MKKKWTICLGALALVLIAGVVLATASTTTAYSPDRVYKASHSTLTKLTVVQKTAEDLNWRFSGSDRTSFVWSPDSRYVAMNYETGNRKSAEIMDTVNSSSTYLPTKEAIIAACPLAATADPGEDGMRLEVTHWESSDAIWVTFEWPADEPGKMVSGSLLFRFGSYQILEASAEILDQN